MNSLHGSRSSKATPLLWASLSSEDNLNIIYIEGVARTMRSFDIFIVTGSVSPPLQLRFIMSLSWVTRSTDVFYTRANTGDRVPAIVFGSSPQPRDFLRIQYEVGGKIVLHEAAALHRIEFQIGSPSPSPSLSAPQRHEDNSGGPIAEDGEGVATATDTLVDSKPNEDPLFQPENVDLCEQPQPEAPVEPNENH